MQTASEAFVGWLSEENKYCDIVIPWLCLFAWPTNKICKLFQESICQKNMNVNGYVTQRALNMQHTSLCFMQPYAYESRIENQNWNYMACLDRSDICEPFGKETILVSYNGTWKQKDEKLLKEHISVHQTSLTFPVVITCNHSEAFNTWRIEFPGPLWGFVNAVWMFTQRQMVSQYKALLVTVHYRMQPNKLFSKVSCIIACSL